MEDKCCGKCKSWFSYYNVCVRSGKLSTIDFCCVRFEEGNPYDMDCDNCNDAEKSISMCPDCIGNEYFTSKEHINTNDKAESNRTTNSIAEIYKSLSDEQLLLAYCELIRLEDGGSLQEGIIRDCEKQLKLLIDSYDMTANINNILREMARRWAILKSRGGKF